MSDTQLEQTTTTGKKARTPSVLANRLSLALSGVSAWLMALAAALARSESHIWHNLSGNTQAIIALSALAALLYGVYAVVWLRQKRVGADGARRAAPWPASVVAVSVLIVLATAVLPWTKWPFDVAFSHERAQVEEFARRGEPFDGRLQFGRYVLASQMPTAAGPLFPSMACLRGQAGYLHRPEGPPPEHTAITVADEQGNPSSDHAFSRDLPAVERLVRSVWELEEQR